MRVRKFLLISLSSLALACSHSAVIKTKEKTGNRVMEPAIASQPNFPLTQPAANLPPLKLKPQRVSLANGKTFNLFLPEGFRIQIAAQGLKRVRFMAKAPDDRIFVTDMYDLTDNRKGSVYILEGFDPKSGQFKTVIPYLTKLRNPNSVTFYTDLDGKQWLYLALTDSLVRYPYRNGDNTPSGKPQILAKFPDYGLSYKYGGWHLTRTVAIFNNKIYVSVGSSCNACEEKEPVRASIIEMDPDGKNQRIFARGLRNSVGIKWVNGNLFATGMGADHLGDNKPEETLYRVERDRNYGWPYCYQYQSRVYADEQFGRSPKKINCNQVPLAYATFGAHSAPLGLEYFNASNSDPRLQNTFLIALHGSSILRLNRGYRVATVRQGAAPETFMSGFLQNGIVYGRPCDILSIGKDAFLLTDDYSGVVYYISK